MVHTIRFGRHEVYITDQNNAQYWNVPSPKIWTSFWHKSCRLDFVVSIAICVSELLTHTMFSPLLRLYFIVLQCFNCFHSWGWQLWLCFSSLSVHRLTDWLDIMCHKFCYTDFLYLLYDQLRWSFWRLVLSFSFTSLSDLLPLHCLRFRLCMIMIKSTVQNHQVFQICLAATGTRLFKHLHSLEILNILSFRNLYPSMISPGFPRLVTNFSMLAMLLNEQIYQVT